MSDLVTAWNKETGKKHPFPVPRHWIDHPTLRPPLSDKPVDETAKPAASKTGAKTKKTASAPAAKTK